MRNTIILLLTTLIYSIPNTTRERETEIFGQKIEAFDIAFEDEYGLCAGNIKTGKKTLVDPEGKYGCISRDGKQIAYIKQSKIYIMDFGTRMTHLINTPWKSNYSPMWSPDNKQIVFMAYQDSKTYIGVTGKDFKEITTIATTKFQFGGPIWALDGTGIIYSEYGILYVSDLSGKPRKKYNINDISTQFTIGNPNFMLTPNGRYFVYLVIPDAYAMKTPSLITLTATDLQTMKMKQVIPQEMEAEEPFMDEAGNIYFRGGRYGSKERSIYKASLDDTLPKKILPAVSGFTIRNNVKLSFPIKLTSCDNCPKAPARTPVEYKEEVK